MISLDKRKPNIWLDGVAPIGATALLVTIALASGHARFVPGILIAAVIGSLGNAYLQHALFWWHER